MARGRLFLLHWHAEEAELLAAPLRRDGWDVRIESEDGARAGKAILAEPPAAVVVYLTRLPSHGRETMRGLRGFKTGRAIPILFVDGDDAVIAKTRTKVRDAQFVTEPSLKRALARYASP